MVVLKHQKMLVVVLVWPEVVVVDLDEVLRLRAVDGRAKWRWHLLSSNRDETMDAGTEKKADVCG